MGPSPRFAVASPARRIAVGLVAVWLLAAPARRSRPDRHFLTRTPGVRVYDAAGIFRPDTIAKVGTTIRGIEERTGAQVVV